VRAADYSYSCQAVARPKLMAEALSRPVLRPRLIAAPFSLGGDSTPDCRMDAFAQVPGAVAQSCLRAGLASQHSMLAVEGGV